MSCKLSGFDTVSAMVWLPMADGATQINRPQGA
jgi:hypothetical protein